MKKFAIFLLCSAFITLGFQGKAQIINSSVKKKVIFFGWTSPTIREYRDSIKKYENPAFEGLGLKPSTEIGGGNIFMVDLNKSITAEARKAELLMASSIKQSSVLTDNFLTIYGASQLDWFSDDDWAIVDVNIRHIAKLAKAMKCKGILWDPEPYKPGINPWELNKQKGYDKYTFNQFYTQVRKRGAQFVSALQEEFPGLVILSLRQLSDFQDCSPFSQKLLPVKDNKLTEKYIVDAWWALHLPFTVGIFDAIAPNVRFIDANEEAYYYTSALEYFQYRNIIYDDARALIPNELQQKFKSNYEIGHAIAPEYIAGNWAGLLGGFSKGQFNDKQAKMLTAKEKALWFEHNSYYSLRTSDEYAWVYGENINWWTGAKMPEGFAEALIRAKKKCDTLEPLGFTVEEMLKKAQDKADMALPTETKK